MTVVPISCQSEGALEVYIEPVVPAPHLVIVGRSPMAHTLADLAGALGWRAELVAAEDFTAAAASERSMVVVATQGHGDEEAVGQAVAARPAYLGLVGSHRRGAAVLGYLADQGLPADQLGRVRVPAGLDLGHITHREIAVAILAELVQLRASGALAGAAGGAPAENTAAPAAGTTPAAKAPATPGPATPTAAGPATPTPAGAATPTPASPATPPPASRAPPTPDCPATPTPAGPATPTPAGPATPAPAQAVDPVCGMTVPASRASFPLAHDGVTYYFCSANCRRRFEQDPAAYAPKETRC